MPINELEQHPCLNYEYNPNTDYKGLIIGTFPVYGSTDTLDKNLDIVNNRLNLDQVRMKFFYGSKDSQLWKYLFLAHGQEEGILPAADLDAAEENRRTAINFLNRNKLLITDVIKRVNRKDYSPSDKDLWIKREVNNFVSSHLLLNYSIIDLLESNKAIQSIFFTATGTNGNTPYGWFIKILKDRKVPFKILNEKKKTPSDNLFSIKIRIKERVYALFFLPTPKPRGIHLTQNSQNTLFLKYIQNRCYNFYEDIINQNLILNQNQENDLKIFRKEFLVDIYKQAIVKHNFDFDGSNPL